MSKFCGNCGAQLDDSAQVCGFCGVSLGVNAGAQNIAGVVTPQDEERAKKMKKYITLGAAGVAAIIVLVIVINIISGFTGYKGAVRKVMKAYEDREMATLVEMTSGLYEEIGEEVSEDSQEYLETMVENAVDYKMESYSDKYGSDLKISYKIKSAHDLDDWYLEKIQESAEDEELATSFDKIKVVELKVKVKGSKRDGEHTMYLWLNKEDDGWKVLAYSKSSSVGSALDIF